MKLKDINNLKHAVMGGLPAAEKKYSIKEFKEMLLAYKDFNNKDLRNNLKYFLKEIIPVAEENKVKMALHPDDPPLPLFGVPRIVSNLGDYKSILNSYDSYSNGVTFCAGSLASNIKNNVYDIFDSQLTISELFRILDVPFSLEDHETIAILLEMFLIAIIYVLICTYIFYGKRGLWLSTPLWLKRILNK